MKKIFNKENVIIYLITFIFSSIILCGFLSGHYATDTYKIEDLGYEEYSINYWLKDGRIIMASVGFLASVINIPIDMFVVILTLLGIAISSFVVILLYRIILKFISTDNKCIKALLLIISYVTIFNFMYLENLYFVDIFAMSISVLAYISAAYILCEKKKWYFVKSLFLSILGIFAYQATISTFIAFTLLFTILKNVTNINIDKKVIQDILEMIIILIITVLLNLFFVKIIVSVFQIEQTRISGIENILINIKIILGGIPVTLINTCCLYPKGAFLVFLFITLLIFGIYNIKKKNGYKNLWLILFILLALLSAFAVNLLSVSAFYSGRMRFIIGALIGMVYIYMYVKSNIFEEKNILKNILVGILIIYFVFGNYIYINNINFHKENNAIEKNEVTILNEYVKEYEKENNIEIKYLACVLDNKNPGKAFGTSEHQMVLTYNALKCDWAVKAVINFYTGRELLRVYEKYDEEDYDTFVNSGLEYMCIKNVLYTKIYAR